MRYWFLLSLVLMPYACVGVEEPQFAFQEVWAYFYNREKHFLQGKESITDLVLFSAAVNEIGVLQPKLPEIEQFPMALRQGRRVHLAITAVGGKTLMYFCLARDRELRNGLIASIVSSAQRFDGVQIDFESLRAEEKEPFVTFLRDIKSALPKHKILSVCLPARTRTMADAFPYSEISAVVDRVIIMAYDEHYRGSKPGPIASIDWCRRVALYAQKEIPAFKLVMGVPFYGRVWQTEEVAKALSYSRVLDLWKKYQSPLLRHAGDIPSFSFRTEVEGVVYYDDVKSLRQKLSLYSRTKIENIAFWRVSQEPIAIWNAISISRAN